MASSLAVRLAATILAHPGRFTWETAEDGTIVHVHLVSGSKGRVIVWVTGDPELPPLGGEDALAALKAFDIRAAIVHLVYAAYATKLKRPWEEGFIITGQQMADALGLTRRRDMNQQDKLNLILRLARQPAQLLVHIDWPAMGKREPFTIERSRLWHIEATYNGQQQPSGSATLRELDIHVRPGPWAEYFLNPQGRKEGKALQYGYLTQNCLKAMMSCWQKNPGTVRLMIWLLFQSRVEMKDQYHVSTLLEIAYGQDALDQARPDRRRRSELAKRWDNDLLVLYQHGCPIAFDPATYPPHLQPEWTTDHDPSQLERLHKYFDQLLQARCGIRPPAEIESALFSITSKKTNRRPPQVRQPLLTKEEIRAARHAKGVGTAFVFM